MQFSMKCSDFVRLSKVCSFFEPTTPLQMRSKINIIRFEVIDKKLLAIITNNKIAVVEFICNIDSPNEV